MGEASLDAWGSRGVSVHRDRSDRSGALSKSIASGLVALLLACSKPAPPPTEAELKAEDKATLEKIIATDVKVSRAMKEADDAAMLGDAGAAVDVVEKRARTGIDEGLAMAQGAQMKTDWGRGKRDEVVTVLKDRQAEIPRYEAAAKSPDPEKIIESVEAQAAIERRMLVVVAAVQEGR